MRLRRFKSASKWRSATDAVRATLRLSLASVRKPIDAGGDGAGVGGSGGGGGGGVGSSEGSRPVASAPTPAVSADAAAPAPLTTADNSHAENSPAGIGGSASPPPMVVECDGPGAPADPVPPVHGGVGDFSRRRPSPLKLDTVVEDALRDGATPPAAGGDVVGVGGRS
jgi:hypothetical protein